VARLLFGIRCRFGASSSLTRVFQQERASIAKLITNVTAGRDPELGRRRVLIARPAGLEDSSRFWSAWMTLDHLRIVNEAIAGVITSLAQGVIPEGEASTAAVKPATDVTAAVIEPYERSCDTLLAALPSAALARRTDRFPHPWFGPLNASGWHALAGTHMGIHRVQLERIAEGIRRADPPARER